MAAPATDAKYHVLLIGVDDYTTRPLGGCVNDIDAVQRVLLGERMKLPTRCIRRLASPLPGTAHETAVPEQPATLANIRAALAALGSDEVSPGDRVFLYYSGHGTRAEVSAPDGRTSHREALVPVDHDARPGSRFLFDFELNALLRAIVARTRSVAVVLDCCFAAGATRDSTGLPRFLEIAAPLPDPAGTRGDEDAHRVGGVDDCHVVSACMNHEVAREEITDGRRNGLLTRAFVEALDAAKDADLRTVTWARIWPAMQAHVRRHNPAQHPSMAGQRGRAVFGGPPVDGDPGLAMSRDGHGYRIEAGTLAGITSGAVLAVYGEDPREFPPLGSAEDRVARQGLVRVTTATDATATATVEGPPFELPFGARGRLVEAAAAARLPCAVVPAHPTLERQLAASPLLQLVAPASADVKLEQHGHRWFVTDDLHGTRPPAPILVALEPDQLDRARAVLEHYHAYSRPLRIATSTSGSPHDLELSVLRCAAREIPAREAQETSLPEAPSRSDGRYVLLPGSTVCFQVRNHSRRQLHVTLVNSAASGKVQLLGDQVIDPKKSCVFWARNDLGAAFQMVLPGGIARCVDRLVAIGRTEKGHALDFLRTGQAFAQVIERARSAGRPIDDGGEEPGSMPGAYWTSATAIIETREA